MTDAANWTLEVRTYADAEPTERELSLEQLRSEVAAGTIHPTDEVRSTFALDGKWHAVEDIESLALTTPTAEGMSAELSFAVAALALSVVYAAILGAKALTPTPTLAMWLLVPIAVLAVLLIGVVNGREPLVRYWPGVGIAAVAIAIGIGIVVDAPGTGARLFGLTALQLLFCGFAAKTAKVAEANANWVALCAFSLPIAAIFGAIARMLPMWLLSKDAPSAMAGEVIFYLVAAVIPALVIAKSSRGSMAPARA